MSKLESGATRLIHDCLAIKPHDRVVIITETARKDIADAIEVQLIKQNTAVLSVSIEDFISRPATEFPEQLRNKIAEFKPTVSIYAATAQKGELPVFRRPLMQFLTKDCNCRHAHMVGIDKKVFEIGMNQDYEAINIFTRTITGLLQKTTRVHASCPYGTDVTFDIDNTAYQWDPCTGIIIKQGTFSNLPDGETFTCPSNVNGTIVAWVLGDTFDHYGVLKKPLIVTIKDSYITDIKSETPGLVEEFTAYINEHENGNRVGELGIGTLVGLKSFTGNLLLDEKFPGIHVAFGYPYPELTGAKWNCPSHIDIIPKEVSLGFLVNDQWKKVMENGVFII